MPTTSNFGWTTPADTDLVKDGAAAIRTLGNGVDTSFVDLKGGTTGQILSKASNTDLDYTWINNDTGDITGVTAGTGISGGGTTGTVTITNSMATEITAAGDIIVGTGSGTFDNLPIGTTGQLLTADTTVSPYKVKWASPATTGANWTLLNAGGTALTGAATVTVSGISGVDQIMVLVAAASSANVSSFIRLRLNTDTGSNYYVFGRSDEYASTYAAANGDAYEGGARDHINLGKMSANAGSSVTAGALITGCNASGVKMIQNTGAATPSTSSGHIAISTVAYYNSASTISSISIVSSTGNLDNGTVYVYTSTS